MHLFHLVDAIRYTIELGFDVRIRCKVSPMRRVLNENQFEIEASCKEKRY
jgi:hypothetical protein